MLGTQLRVKDLIGALVRGGQVPIVPEQLIGGLEPAGGAASKQRLGPSCLIVQQRRVAPRSAHVRSSIRPCIRAVNPPIRPGRTSARMSCPSTGRPEATQGRVRGGHQAVLYVAHRGVFPVAPRAQVAGFKSPCNAPRLQPGARGPLPAANRSKATSSFDLPRRCS